MSLRRAVHVFEYNLLVYRRVWRGSIIVSFVSPLFFLGAMGVGLGALVNRHSGGVNGVPYRDFLAPALLAAAAMQTASVEATYPLMAKIRWQRLYEGMLATPLSTADVLVGETAWFAFRLALVSAVFFIVMLLFGAVHAWTGPLAVLAGLLTGLAFVMPIAAWTATRLKENEFAAMQRFVIMPLFLFAGTFFPLSRLPLVLQWAAQALPLYHGVELARGLCLGTVTLASAALHTAVLCAYTIVGIVAASFTFRRRLVI
ncbi:MAG: ABC transporter permease [Candidatus Dormibacteria bacterium]